jgi:putative addiction module killer protein
MITIKTTPAFDTWLSGIKDRVTYLRLSRRLDRAQQGNLGDIKSVGEGIFEMREHFGPGWRMYYVQRGGVVIVLLGGGDTSSQPADIARAVKIAETIEE